VVKTIAYVDGFNLYFACFHHQEFQEDGERQRRDPLFERLQRGKWLDIGAPLRRVSPDAPPDVIHYFTARVSSPASDPDRAERQQTYLRALEWAGVNVHIAQFKKVTKPGRLKTRIACQAAIRSVPDRVHVELREEKGSDVHLGAMLVRDAFTSRFERAIVVSNDTDLAPAIDMAVAQAGKTVHVISPYRQPSTTLQRVASNMEPLARELILECQLPDEIRVNEKRRITKPAAWH
jgi:uncharacterized LabA/DUF88 family protein